MLGLVALTTHLSGKHRCHFRLASFSHKTRQTLRPRVCREIVVSAGSLYCAQLLAHLSEFLPVVGTRCKRKGVSLRRPYGT